MAKRKIQELNAGDILYKIKKVDFNGDFKWTKVVFVHKNAKASVVSVSPNPSDNQFVISANNFINGTHNVKIVDVNGKVVQEFVLNVTKGIGEQTISVSYLPVGIYSIVGLGEAIKISVQR